MPVCTGRCGDREKVRRQEINTTERDVAMADTRDFGRGSVAKNILSMAIPMTIAQMVNVLYNVVDRFFIGHVPGASSLALTGVGIVFPIISIITAFTNLFGMGGAPLCSIAWGRQEHEKAEEIIGTAFFMLVTTSFVLTAVGMVFMRPLLYLFGASTETYAYAQDYFSFYIWGSPFAMIGLGMNGFINSQGFGTVGMMTIAIGALINIILDPIFIFALQLGVRGAAIATVLSQLLSAVWVLRFLTGKKAILKLRRQNIRWRAPILKRVVQLGLSHFVMSFTNAITQFAYNTTLQSFGGDVYVGAMTVINSVREVVTMPVNGIASGAQPVLGYNYGAQKYDRVKKGIIFMTLVCLIYMLLAWGVVFRFPAQLMGIFNNNAELIGIGAQMMHIYFFGFCFMAFQMSGQSAFTSLGYAKYAIFFSLFRKVMVVLPLIFILPRFMGVDGILWSEPISNLVGGLFCFTTMMFTIWRKLPHKASSSQ